MKTIFLLIFFFSSLYSNYSITYLNLKLGVIKDISTVKQNYFKADVTNSLAKFLLGKKHFVFYNEKHKLAKENKKTKYKKDKYYIIEILKRSLDNTLEEGKIHISKQKYIEIAKNDNYSFKYISKGKIKSYGKIIVKNNELISLVDEKNKVKIIKN